MSNTDEGENEVEGEEEKLLRRVKEANKKTLFVADMRLTFRPFTLTTVVSLLKVLVGWCLLTQVQTLGETLKKQKPLIENLLRILKEVLPKKEKRTTLWKSLRKGKFELRKVADHGTTKVIWEQVRFNVDLMILGEIESESCVLRPRKSAWKPRR